MQRLLDAEKQSFDVDIELPVEMFLGHCSQWRYLPQAGVRKQNIDVPELRFDFGVKAVQIFEMRHVPLDSNDILTNLGGRLIQFILAASGNDDLSALFDETLGCFQADAAVRTGNYRNLSSKSAHNTHTLLRNFSWGGSGRYVLLVLRGIAAA